MRLEIDTTQLQRWVNLFNRWQDIYLFASNASLIKVLNYLRGRVRQRYEGGQVTPGRAELTKLYVRKFKSSSPIWFRQRKPTTFGPFEFLGKLTRFRIDKEKQIGKVSFAKDLEGEGFDKDLQKIAAFAEVGAEFPVTQKMRGLFGRQALGQRDRVQGQNFFPLKGSTTVIKIPKRDFVTSIFRHARIDAREVFEPNFAGLVKDEVRKIDGVA